MELLCQQIIFILFTHWWGLNVLQMYRYFHVIKPQRHTETYRDIAKHFYTFLMFVFIFYVR